MPGKKYKTIHKFTWEIELQFTQTFLADSKVTDCE